MISMKFYREFLEQMNFALILMFQNLFLSDYYFHRMIIAKYGYNYLENK